MAGYIYVFREHELEHKHIRPQKFGFLSFIQTYYPKAHTEWIVIYDLHSLIYFISILLFIFKNSLNSYIEINAGIAGWQNNMGIMLSLRFPPS